MSEAKPVDREEASAGPAKPRGSTPDRSERTGILRDGDVDKRGLFVPPRRLATEAINEILFQLGG